MKLTDYIGKELEYLGGFPREIEFGLKIGQKYFIEDVYGCCFLISWPGEFQGNPHKEQACINHERFKKE